MIFKTITSSVDESRKTLALFNKDWNTYKTNWQNANGIGGKIGSIFASSNAGTSASVISNNQVQILRNWNNAVKHGCTNQATFNRIIANADENTKMYFAGLNKGKGSIDGLKNAQKVATQSTIGLTIAQTALNMAVAMGITALVSIIEKGYDELANSVENCKERVDDLMSSYKSALDTANNNASRVEELADKYEDLSKGVNNLGENVSLTNEEYQEYNSLANEIADMFPALVQGYTDEGNAILNLKGNVEQLRDAYKEAQQEAYNLLITSGEDADSNDIIKQWEDTHDTGFWASILDLGADDVGGGISVADALKQLRAIQQMSAEEYREIERITGSGSRKEIAGLTDIEKEIGYGSYLYKALGLDSGSTDEEFRNAQKQAKALIQTYNAEIESALSDVETLANAYLMTNEDYDKLDSQSKSAASMIVNNLNADIANGFSSKEDVANYVDGIVQSLSGNEDVRKALVKLFTIDTTDMSIDEVQQKVDEYVKTVATELDEDPIELKTRLGFDNSDTEPLVNKIKGFLSDEFDGKVGELTLEELEIASSKLEIPEGTLLTWDELIAKIREVQGLASNNETDILSFKDILNAEDFKDTKEELLELAKSGELTPYTLSSTKEYNELLKETGTTAKEATEQLYNMVDANTRLSAFSTNMSNVDKAYSEFKTNGFNTMDDFSGLESAFGDLNSYKKFIQVAGDAKSSTQEIQNAYNKLVTEYVYSIGILDTVNESNRGLIQTQLEHLGITNAEEIVTKALNGDILSLASAKSILTQYGYDLISVTSGELNALVKEGNISKETAKQIALFALKKKIANGITISTIGDMQNLANLAGVGEKAAKILARIAEIKNNLHNGDGPPAAAMESTLNELKSQLQKELNKGNKVNLEYSGGEATTTAIDKQVNKNKETYTKFAKTIDWCAETITNLTNKIGNLNAKLNNTDALKNQIKYYKQLINAQNGLVKGYEKTADRYQKVYNKALKKLSKSDQNKVKNGAYTIEQFSGKAKSGKKSGAEKRYNNIQKAIEARDNVVSNSNNLIDAKAQLKEYAEGLASIRWDKASEKVDKLSNSISVLDTKLSNASGYKAKSAILKEQLDLQKRSVTAQENAVKNTQNDANSYLKKISSKYKKNKNKDGTIKTTGVTDKAQLKLITVYNAYVRKLAEETVELSQAQENYKSAVNDAAISNSEFVQSDYDNKVSLLEDTENRLNSEIELAETRGQVASADYYKSLTDNAEKIKKQREEEKALLEEQIKDVKPYTDTWYILKQAIFDVDAAIAEQSKNAVDNINKQIKAMTGLTSKMNAYISSATDALGWFDDLIESEDLYDDNGNLTNKAYASLKLKEGEVEGSKTRQSNYEKDLLELDRNYANGEMTQAQYLDAKLELEKNIRGEIKTQIDLRKEQNDIIKESYKEQKKSLDEIIDKKKKALSLDKSEHDYRKSITEKTKNIADLQKQIAMLKSDTSEEAKAQRQKLEVELKDAQDDLDDTQWDKYIERYENAMDNLSDRLDVLIEKLDDLTSDGIKQVITTNEANANNGINEIAQENGIDTKVLGDTANDTLNGSSTFDAANEKAKEVYSSDTSTGQKQEDTSTFNAGKTIGQVILNGEIPDDIKKLLGDSDTSNSNYVEATGVPLLSKDVVNKVKKFINNKDNTEKAKKKKSEYGILNKEIYDITNGRILSKANRLKLAKMLNITDANKDGDITGAEAKKVVELLKQIPGFSSGGIVEVAKRNGDDGLVTLKAGESVLTPVQTDALMQLGKNLVPLNNFMDIIQRPNIPGIARSNNSSSTSIDSVNFEFNLPNVVDGESLIKTIQTDTKVQKTLENATIGKLNSGNKRFGANRL